MTGSGRSLPVRVPLLEGEALDSWLFRLAIRNTIPAQHLLPSLELSEPARRWRNHGLIHDLPTALLRRIESQTGLTNGRLDHAVLDRFASLGWEATSGSRYCIDCLGEPDPYWRIRWRLSYSLACTRHSCLLAVCCPACGLPLFRRVTKLAGTLPPTHCTSPTGKSSGICGADLRESPLINLTHNDPRIKAQRWIDERLDRMDGPFTTDLRDLDVLARWYRKRIVPGDVACLDAATADAFTALRDPRQRWSPRAPRPDAILVDAAATCFAVGLLTAEDPAARYQRFHLLFRTVPNADKPRAIPSAPAVLSRKALEPLSVFRQQQILAACDRHLGFAERLRYYTSTAYPRMTEAGSTVALERARWVPQHLWQDWLIRFTPQRGFRANVIAIELPIALLLPGNPLRRIRAASELSPRRNKVGVTLQTLVAHYPDVLTAIHNLAGYLDSHGGAIDYRRRRQVFTNIDLTERQWEQFCHEADIRPGQGTKVRMARLYLFELLTGTNALTHGSLPEDIRSKSAQSYSYAYRHSMTHAMRGRLHAHARELLDAAGIAEPLSWSPPDSCVTGIRLPGIDPNSLSSADIVDCVEHQHLTPSAIAQRFGTSLQHIYYLMEPLEWRVHSLGLKPRTTDGRRARKTQSARIPGSRRSLAAHVLTKDFLEEHLVKQAMSTFELGQTTGFSSDTVRQHAKRHGIARHPLTTAARFNVDVAWFRVQAETHHRTNTELAAELGLSHRAVSKIRAQLGITPSTPGAWQRPHCPDLPVDVRNAIEGRRNGWTRLYRFEQVMAYPFFSVAAKELGYAANNLSMQMAQLERDIGGKLINRARHPHPMRSTPRGERLLAALESPQIQVLMHRYARTPVSRSDRSSKSS
ncbi:TniQ family protein [Glycomyces tritici]|uniref:TniQ family protein n=1 Tax=Glycomyces tritici TaxID=2665176 RepID=A0ABT7YKP9_9ACTN|nr:TniQ family protein [Glycomyces tritici]MDN3239214.1 TniQ family protein [Glycomyces tritici]